MARKQAVQHDNPTHWVERRTYPDASTMLIERPETVSIGFSTQVTGLSSTGKPWFRWQRGDRITFSLRRNRSGRRVLHVYRYQRRQTQTMFGNRTAVIHDLVPLRYQPVVAEALKRLWRRNVGDVPSALINALLPELTTGLAFPALAGRPLRYRPGFEAQPVAPTGLTHVWRQDTARGVAEQLFGQRALRKDLIRASATVEPMRAGVAHAVRTLVPVDHLVEYMQQDGRVEHWDRRALHDLFNVVAPSARRRLLLQTQVLDQPRDGWGYSDDALTITDALRCVRELNQVYGPNQHWATDEVRKPKTWRTLHDDLSRLLRRAETPDVPIPPTRHARAIDGLVTNAGTLRAAARTSDLYGWGDAMDNCIASYAREAVDGITTLFGLYRADALIANMEVSSDGDIEQLFGRFNELLPDSEDRSVRDAVTVRLAATAARAVAA
jgi:hypothetical protein